MEGGYRFNDHLRLMGTPQAIPVQGSARLRPASHGYRCHRVAVRLHDLLSAAAGGAVQQSEYDGVTETMKRQTFTLGCLVFGALGLLAPVGAASPQGAAGLPPAVVAAIDSIFLPMSHSGEPGCAVGIYQNGAVTFARGYGFANLTHDVPIIADHPIHRRARCRSSSPPRASPCSRAPGASRSTTTCGNTSRR